MGAQPAKIAENLDWQASSSIVELEARPPRLPKPTTESGKRYELYHVLEDRGQLNDVAADNMALVHSMLAPPDNWKGPLPPAAPSQKGSASAGKKARPERPVLTQAHLSEVFQRWDKDGDGALSSAEYTNGLADKSRADARFRNFDKNVDSRLTHGEFTK